MSAVETRAALEAAVIRLVSTGGVRAVTARAVATEAGVNQALVFYHFEGVEGLMREAFDRATTAMIDDYVTELSGAQTFADLHAVGRRLAERSRADGSASLLAQVVAAAHTDPQQAELLTRALRSWHTALTDVVRRVLAASGLDREVDVETTTAALAAATIGMITIDAVPGRPLGDTLVSTGHLAVLADRVLRFVPAPIARLVMGRKG